MDAGALRSVVSIAVCAVAATPSAAAQSLPDSARAEFAETVRAATAVFHDRDQAIAAGYRLIGPDFPGMGEHWVNIALLMQHVLDPARPTILSYANIGERPTLIGVAFAVSLGAGESPPRFPAGDASWHFHSGTVHAESFLPRGMSDSAGGRRLAVLHAWVWLANPDGMFARDNWALPYARAGLAVPARPDPRTAQALALVAGNRDYYRMRFAAARASEPIAEAAGTVARLLSWPDPVERDRLLADVWAALCARIGEACGGS